MKKNILRTALGVVLSLIVVTVLSVMMNGVPIFGAPNPKDVESVTVTAAGNAGETYTDPENIELAVKLINSLNYQPFTPVTGKAGPDVTITYRLKDGRELTAAANWVTGWWNGEARALKEPDMFVKLADGVFGLKLEE